MTLRGVFALAVFAILCICHVGAAYEVTCSGRVIQYNDEDSMKAAVWKRVISAMAAIYSSSTDLRLIKSLNDTIVSRMEAADFDLKSRASYFTNKEKENIAQIAKKAEESYKLIAKYDLNGLNAEVKKAEALLTSISEESEDSLCMSDKAVTIGQAVQNKVKPLSHQFQEVYDTLETFRQTMKNYAALEDARDN